MNIPQTPRQRTKAKALEQKREINDRVAFHESTAIKTKPSNPMYRANFDRIYRGNQ